MPTYKNRKCSFCEQKIAHVDYKNIPLISKFVSQYNRIVPKYYSGTCLKHQKKVTTAIKNARLVALLPFTH